MLSIIIMNYLTHCKPIIQGLEKMANYSKVFLDNAMLGDGRKTASSYNQKRMFIARKEPGYATLTLPTFRKLSDIFQNPIRQRFL